MVDSTSPNIVQYFCPLDFSMVDPGCLRVKENSAYISSTETNTRKSQFSLYFSKVIHLFRKLYLQHDDTKYYGMTMQKKQRQPMKVIFFCPCLPHTARGRQAFLIQPENTSVLCLIIIYTYTIPGIMILINLLFIISDEGCFLVTSDIILS